MERNYLSILFFIKRTKLLKNGEAPICLRITVNGKRAEVQIKRSVEVNKWNSQKECATGRDNKTLELNHYLETVRTKILKIHRQLKQKNLSTHVARHSFACIALANKVSKESIAKMLGHSDIKTTKIYAKVLDRTISEEMQALREKFAV